MYRAIAGLFVLLLASVAVGGVVHGTVSADDATTETTAAIVGTWEYFQPGYGASGHFTFSSDRTVIFVGSDGETMLGTWVQDGGQIVVTVESANPDGTGQGLSWVFPSPDADDDAIEMVDGSSLDRVTPDMSIATPYADLGLPDPSICTATPRTRDEVAAILADGTTPAESPSVEHESDLPKGEPVDPETATQVVEISLQFVACLNAADWPRWLGMMTDNAIRQVGDEESLNVFFDTVGTPQSDASGIVRTTVFQVRDVRLMSDGRVGAVVEWGRIGAHSDGTSADEVNFHIFVRDGNTWLLDEEISGFSMWRSAGEPEPNWSTEATPVAS